MTSGVSGPMMVRSIFSARASAIRPGVSPAATGALRTRGSPAVPALPGATSTSRTDAAAAQTQARACSRPPLPTTRIFIRDPALMPEMAQARVHHGHAVCIGGRDYFGVALGATGLDDGGNALGRGDVDTVAERKVGVGGHDRTAHREFFIGRLESRDAAGVHAAHLAGNGPDGHAVAR